MPTTAKPGNPSHLSDLEWRAFSRISRRRAHRIPPLDVVARAQANHRRWRLNGIPMEDISLSELLETMLPISGGASNFTLTLDTTGPAGVTVSINAGAAYATTQSVTLTIATSDTPTTGYTMKVWGDVDLANDANVQDTEIKSAWITYSTSQAVKLSAGDGSKSITIRIRDDVWNESSTANDTITLDTTVPVATISVGPDVTRVSKISGKRVCSFSFQADVHIQAWKVKVVPATNSIESAGTTILTTNGSTNMTGGALAATTNQACTIDGRDLEVASSGDGAKIVKVFCQDDAGNWSTA
jgi:hypothetical protein